MVKHQDPLEREEVRKVEEKLERCRNQQNNPESDLLVLILILKLIQVNYYHTNWDWDQFHKENAMVFYYIAHPLYFRYKEKMDELWEEEEERRAAKRMKRAEVSRVKHAS